MWRFFPVILVNFLYHFSFFLRNERTWDRNDVSIITLSILLTPLKSYFNHLSVSNNLDIHIHAKQINKWINKPPCSLSLRMEPPHVRNSLQCSKECGNGTSTREVVCVVFLSGTFRATLDIECNPESRPNSTQPCNPDVCPPHWYYTDWSPVWGRCFFLRFFFLQLVLPVLLRFF